MIPEKRPFAQSLLKLTTSALRVRPVLAAIGFAAMVSPVYGANYVSTLGNPEEVEMGFGSDRWLGFAFTTDNESYTINDITARIGTTPSIGGAINLFGVLYQGTGTGLPLNDTVLQTFTNTPLLDSASFDVTFTPVGEYILAANTTYVFAIQPVADEEMGYWWFSEETWGYDTDVPGSTWGMPVVLVERGGPSGEWADMGFDSYRFLAAVDASPSQIPEPSSLLLLGAAGALGWGLRRARH